MPGSRLAGTRNLARSCGATGNQQCGTVQSSTYSNFPSYLGNDGRTTCGYDLTFTHTNFDDPDAWWRVDFGITRLAVGGIIWGRCDCCQSRLDGFRLWIGDSPTYNGQGNTNCYTAMTTPHYYSPYTHAFTCVGQGRYFFVHLPSGDALSLIEVQVQGRSLGTFADVTRQRGVQVVSQQLLGL